MLKDWLIPAYGRTSYLADLYKNIDFHAKVMSEQQNKQPILRNGKKHFKVDCIIADQTITSIKLVCGRNSSTKWTVLKVTFQGSFNILNSINGATIIEKMT